MNRRFGAVPAVIYTRCSGIAGFKSVWNRAMPGAYVEIPVEKKAPEKPVAAVRN
jgi:hypothetical protein